MVVTVALEALVVELAVPDEHVDQLFAGRNRRAIHRSSRW
jgi:hypothetical protein